MLGLASSTHPRWASVALRDEVALLRDHAHLERKAAGQVITLLGRCPEAGQPLLDVVHEELEHFERVREMLDRRGEELGPDPGNPYVRELTKSTRRGLLDSLLRMGLVEARSYERFSLLARTAKGPLADLYESLRESEAGHHAFFIKLAYDRWPREQVRERWRVLSEAEAAIVAAQEWGSRIH